MLLPNVYSCNTMPDDMSQSSLPEIIETKRMILRPYRSEDVEDILAYATDEAWSRFLPVPRSYSRTDAVQFLDRQALLDRSVHPTWAVVADQQVVGGINIRFDFPNRLGEMGWSIARPLWGRGLATEVAISVIEAAFGTHPDLNRIRAMADLRNLASQRVMEKIGMRREGTLRQNRVTREEPIDEAWFGLLRAEWNTVRPA
jgi:ribosomal-protein-alanine N-acetyltransferase